MSILDRLERTRTVLVLLLVVRAAVMGAVAMLVVVLIAATADLLVILPLSARKLATAAALLTGLLLAGTLAWRARAALRLSRVALWVEERVPTLHYALVTLAERPDIAHDGSLTRSVDGVEWGAILGRATGRALGVPMLALVLAFVVLAVVPDGAIARIREPRAGDALERPAMSPRRNHLTPIVVTVTPPPYSREIIRSLDEPVGIGGLVGSRIAIQGPWSERANVVAMLGEASVPVATSRARWSIDFRMPAKAAVLRLRDGVSERIVTVEPRVDRAPAVTLLRPARDSVLRVAAGTLQLTADVGDDIGIASAAFELIVSSGEGESFTFRSRSIALVKPEPGRRTVALRDSLMLGTLGLAPGDILHLRAVARDANDVSGPGLGSSETRTLRIARPSEYDSVAVEGAPPLDPEEGVLSQRMLIMLAEALEKRRPKLQRPVVLSESQSIGRDQKKLRKRVGEIIFSRLGDESHSHDEEETGGGALTPEQMLAAADSATNAGGTLDFAEGESPVVAINKPLLEAYSAMWDATRELEAGDPARALPPMRVALEAIQRARNAERLYLRGRPPVVIVDLAKVRLQGKERGAPSAREPRAAAPDPARALARRLSRALARLEQSDSTVVDSLLVLRIDALNDAPAVAGALADAIDALRRGRDATAPLLRARRSLDAGRVAAMPTPMWSGW